MVEKVKLIRVSIDGLIMVINQTEIRWCDEISASIKSLNLAKMWLGKSLGELGEANPYPESSNPQSDKIEPAADRADGMPIWDDVDMSNIVAVAKKIRSEIKLLENDLSQMFAPNNTSTDLGTFVNQSRLSLIEANMWIGMKLGAIREGKLREYNHSCRRGQAFYESYIGSIKKREAPGTVYPTWEELSPMQKEAWMEVNSSTGIDGSIAGGKSHG